MSYEKVSTVRLILITGPLEPLNLLRPLQSAGTLLFPVSIFLRFISGLRGCKG